MPANTAAIFSRVGAVGFAKATAFNTSRDLTSGTSYEIFRADVDNGGRVEKVRISPLGSNVATVGRIFMTNTNGAGVAANCTLLEEVTLAATTASETARLAYTDVILQLALPPGYRLYFTFGTTVATGFDVTTFGGAY